MEDRYSQPSAPEHLSARSATSLRDLEQRAQAALAASRAQVSRLEAEITKQLEKVAASLQEQTAVEPGDAAESDRKCAEIERLTVKLENSQAAWIVERSALEAARDQLAQQVAQLKAEQQASPTPAEIERLTAELEKSQLAWNAERPTLENARDKFAQQVTQLEAEHQAAQSGWSAERSALEASRDELQQHVAQHEAERQELQKEWKTQLAEFEQKLGERQSIWSDQRSELNERQAALERERGELQQKFELALQDVQRFRGRVAELEQELSRRPETHETDSAELVALRAERDALSERVDELERQPAAQIDANAEQQLADLQRRFELAVEDVRELKTKNAKLESQAAAPGKKGATAPESGNMDWESQKRRLLASLEDSGEESDDPIQQKERGSIESTIEMTDAVVAEKDREIAELKSQLATSVSDKAVASDAGRAQKVDEIVDADKVIVEHRKRIAQLERETEEKLRAAELELSIERAKMARQKAELEDLRADLESQQSAHDAQGGSGASGVPRRRWLSKLGLSGDES